MRVPAAAPLLLAVVLVLPAPAAADLANYHLLPTERDDQGRSDEPDAHATSVLGPRVDNCVVSLDPAQVPGHGRACLTGSAPGVVAPGCTDDSGRQPSGLCGLWTAGLRAGGAAVLPAQAAGVQGMSGTAAPGVYTRTKSATIRLLDIQVALAAPGRYVEVNRKLADTGARGALAAADPDLGGPSVPPAAAMWAWYGLWQDKNGNGVIDVVAGAGGQATPDNEFRWVGRCGALAAETCSREPGLVFPLWVWPGSHHQNCGFQPGCYPLPADFPGRQVACLVANEADAFPLRCPRDLDDEGAVADPLLGPDQGSPAADGAMLDLTDQASPDQRLWHYGLPPAYYYDQSLLTTTLVVGGPTLRGADPAFPAGYDLAALQFVDVDRYPAWQPLLGALLHGEVRPALRGPWVLARDAQDPAAALADGTLHHRAADGPTHGLAAVDASLRDPGWSREPNTPGDRYPGALHAVHAPSGELPAGEQRHRGWLNGVAGHRAGWHAWADVHARRLEFTYGRFTLDGQANTCLPPCGIGGGWWDGMSVLPGPGGFPRPAGEHGRSLEPGVFQFMGFVGAWHDQPHPMAERVLDPLASALAGTPVYREERYTLPPDGWVGNVVNTTGTFRYRGYGEETCTIEGVRAARAWGVCHPTIDGDTANADSEALLDQSFGVGLSDPQDHGDETEFQRLTTPPAASWKVVLRPAGGVWTAPVLVWRDFYAWRAGDAAAFHDLTGSRAPIVLDTLEELAPSVRSRVVTRDLVILPLGNLGLEVTSEFAARVQVSVPGRGIAVDGTVVDVDVYRGWGL